MARSAGTTAAPEWPSLRLRAQAQAHLRTRGQQAGAVRCGIGSTSSGVTSGTDRSDLAPGTLRPRPFGAVVRYGFVSNALQRAVDNVRIMSVTGVSLKSEIRLLERDRGLQARGNILGPSEGPTFHVVSVN